jgi:hypothetical protein
VRYTVRAWCTNYETTHKRCPPTVVAIEFRQVRVLHTVKPLLMKTKIGRAMWSVFLDERER